MAIEDQRKKYAGWEKKLFEFVTNYKPADQKSPFPLFNGLELNYKYLYTSQEVIAIEVSYLHETKILIKIKDDVYSSYLNGKSTPNMPLQYVLDHPRLKNN